MHPFTAAGGLVLTMLVVMLLSFGIVAMLLNSIRRSMGNRDLVMEELIEEVALEATKENSLAVNGAEASHQPWEKDGDWWRGE